VSAHAPGNEIHFGRQTEGVPAIFHQLPVTLHRPQTAPENFPAIVGNDIQALDKLAPQQRFSVVLQQAENLFPRRGTGLDAAAFFFLFHQFIVPPFDHSNMGLYTGMI
jgi:hypothetical protein